MVGKLLKVSHPSIKESHQCLRFGPPLLLFRSDPSHLLRPHAFLRGLLQLPFVWLTTVNNISLRLISHSSEDDGIPLGEMKRSTHMGKKKCSDESVMSVFAFSTRSSIASGSIPSFRKSFQPNPRRALWEFIICQ